jgi:hypothetical protein
LNFEDNMEEIFVSMNFVTVVTCIYLFLMMCSLSSLVFMYSVGLRR